MPNQVFNAMEVFKDDFRCIQRWTSTGTAISYLWCQMYTIERVRNDSPSRRFGLARLLVEDHIVTDEERSPMNQPLALMAPTRCRDGRSSPLFK